ncbi:MAG: PD40 domain-containing protein, partial [Calditrichaeota bacterium]|nr:PD40 domain-containing protein [Calditrichota bacterium]
MYYSFLFVILIFSCTDMLHKPIYSGLGEAERVAPLIVSTNLVEYNSSFSPDGRELFFTRNNEQWSAPQLMKAVLKDGRYQSAEQLTIENVSGDYGDFHLSADGRFLFFSFSKTGKRADIWRAERSGQSWKNAAVLPASVNSDADEFYPTATTDGKLVFASNRSGNMDIYMSDYRDGNYLPALRLPEAINSTGFEGDPMIARDASFIIFVKMNAPDGLGMSDLYIS